ncbi:acyl transferase domain-containing protein [Alteromonadaceae bacterium 2753L.S.0a.02]|nr:acyl transferase domain-containing protein [Alteromonadaceae bacterium 2753L.S.0a.02]
MLKSIDTLAQGFIFSVVAATLKQARILSVNEKGFLLNCKHSDRKIVGDLAEIFEKFLQSHVKAMTSSADAADYYECLNSSVFRMLSLDWKNYLEGDDLSSINSLVEDCCLPELNKSCSTLKTSIWLPFIAVMAESGVYQREKSWLLDVRKIPEKGRTELVAVLVENGVLKIFDDSKEALCYEITGEYAELLSEPKILSSIVSFGKLVIEADSQLFDKKVGRSLIEFAKSEILAEAFGDYLTTPDAIKETAASIFEQCNAGKAESYTVFLISPHPEEFEGLISRELSHVGDEFENTSLSIKSRELGPLSGDMIGAAESLKNDISREVREMHNDFLLVLDARNVFSAAVSEYVCALFKHPLLATRGKVLLCTSHNNCLNAISNWKEFIAAFCKFFERDVVELLAELARKGVVPLAFGQTIVSSSKHVQCTALHYLEKREYSIRYGIPDDIEQLMRIEKASWMPELQTPSSVIKQRLETFPLGQLVAVVDNEVVAVIYSHRILSESLLIHKNVEDVPDLHIDTGSVAHILGLAVLPEYQSRKLGDQLLEFALQIFSATPLVKKIVGVTRCKSFYRYNELSHQEYILKRSAQGLALDPHLNFHEQHGARVVSAIANYRPNDEQNDGYGVLVEYSPCDRKPLEIAGRNFVSQQSVTGTKSYVNQPQIKVLSRIDARQEAIEKSIGLMIHRLKAELAGFTLDVMQPIMEFGFDSIDMMELGLLITEEYGIEIDPLFFFANSTIRQVAKRIIENADPSRLQPTPDVASAMNNPAEKNKRSIKPAEESIAQFITSLVGHCDALEDIRQRPLLDLGLDSSQFLTLGAFINAEFEIATNDLFFFEYNSICKIASYIADQKNSKILRASNSAKTPISKGENETQKVAIVGFAMQVPGTERDRNAFFSNLIHEQSSIGTLPRGRWSWPEGIDKYGDHKGIDAGGFLSDIACFDNEFFRISAAEAELMDPQQRILLELCWQAFEHAGYNPQTLAGSDTGVFLGASGSDYKLCLADAGFVDEAHCSTSIAMSVIPNRLSYFYNFNGPSLLLDTACSSSLVAIHEAVKSIKSRECSVAVAGGINIICHPANTLSYHRAGMLSRDGLCKTFSDDANGYVRSEGAALLVMKSLADAERDGDHIYGVIRGSAINHGGQASGLSAPNPVEQGKLITKALENANLGADQLSYIEAHGTATPLGDPIEIEGLKRAFSPFGAIPRSCAVGSVKTNIGHLEAAAGVAGLVKLLVALQHKTLPGNANFHSLNSKIQLTDSPFYVLDKSQPWELKEHQHKRIAGVSSFGIGGANSHVIVEEYCNKIDQVCSDIRRDNLFLLSAKTPEALQRYVRSCLEHFGFIDRAKLNSEFHALCQKSQTAKGVFKCRLAIVASSGDDFLEKLTLEKMASSSGAASVQKGVYRFTSTNSHPGLDLESFVPLAVQQKNMSALASLWVSGTDIDWQGITDKTSTSLTLPDYPFADNRHWYCRESNLEENIGSIAVKNIAHLPIWKSEEVQGKTKADWTKNTLIVYDSEDSRFPGLASTLLTELEKSLLKHHLIDLQNGDLTTQLSPFSMDSRNSPERIVYLAMSNKYDAQTALDRGQALLEVCQKLKASADLDFYLVTLNAHKTQYDVEANPVSSALTGFIQSVARERSNWAIRSIDFSDRGDLYGWLSPALCEAIITEPANKNGCPTAYRNGMRMHRKLSPINFNTNVKGAFKQQGRYLIVGGSGGLGQLLSKYLITHYNSTLIWVGRREFDENLRELTRTCDPSGTAIEYYSCDVTCAEELKSLVEKFSDTESGINGVFNAAVTTQDARIENLSGADFRKIAASNLWITENILRVFGKQPLDFICLFSSIQSLQCDFGISLYGFISAFKDAYAGISQNGLLAQVPVSVLNWGYWPVGLGDNFQVRQRIVDQIGMQPLSELEGMASLELTLARNLSQVAPVKLAESHELQLVDENYPFTVYEGFKLDGFADELQQLLPNRVSEYQAARDKTFENGALVNLGMSGLIKAFIDLGANELCDNFLSPHEWTQKLGIVERYHRFTCAALELLVEKSVVHCRDRSYRWNAGYDCSGFRQAALDQLNQTTKQDSALRAQSELLHTCVTHLSEILQGSRPATDIMFPGASMDLVAGIYKGNPAADYVNHRVADVIASLVSRKLDDLNGQRPVRILELGAGTGGSSAFIFKRLNEFADGLEYFYTDVSRSFLLYAEDNYKPTYPYIKPHIFDLQKDIAEQDIPEDYFDIVVAANVVHATDDVVNVLSNVKRSMKSGAALVLNEITQRRTFLTLTFGLLDGWWKSVDESIRIPASPLLTPASWRAVLESIGLHQVTVVDGDKTELDQQVIVSISNGVCDTTSAFAAKVKDKEVKLSMDTELRLNSDNYEYKNSVSVEKAVMAGEELAHWLKEKIVAVTASTLRTDAESIGSEQSFADMGVDSILSVSIVKTLNQNLQIKLNSTDLFSYTCVDLLASHIAENFSDKLNFTGLNTQPVTNDELISKRPKAEKSETNIKIPSAIAPNTASELGEDAIAIIGISCQLASAGNANEYWYALKNGQSLITEVPENRFRICPDLDPSHFYRAKHDKHSSYSKWGGFLNDIDCFDASFFKISGDDAQNADPQQRLILQQCWSALEDAAIPGESLRGAKCGVFVGVEAGDYGVNYQQGIEAASLWGNATSIMAARISYFLNLKGPAITVDTACSSSLVALNSACQSLKLGESDLALAGGVSLQTTPNFYVAGSQAHMLSPTGQCYTFDDRADGFVPGEGAAVLVLKRLNDAQRDKDHIYGVIRGIGVNQDGATNGITAPSALSQKELLNAVYTNNQINPADIEMVEAHGTGTKLGDPIEFEALSEVFSRSTTRKNYCALGSAKTNIGHTRAVAGLAGVIKACLSLEHELIPASLNFESCNSNINLNDSPFYVVTDNKEWPRLEGKSRMATVSSFGLSGTNAHAVISDVPRVSKISSSWEERDYVFTFSAKTEDTLFDNIEACHCWLVKPAQQQSPEIQREIIANILSKILALPVNEFCDDASLEELGLDAFLLSEFFEILRRERAVSLRHDMMSGITRFDDFCARIAEVDCGTPASSIQHQLGDIAYTLQVGRSHFDKRVAVVARSPEQLLQALAQLLKQRIIPDQALQYSELASSEFMAYADAWQNSKAPLDPQAIYPARRISMPGYQFSRDRYWKELAATPVIQAENQTQSTTVMNEFSVEADHPWLADHQIEQLKILPGAAHVAIVRDYVLQSFKMPAATLKNMSWHKPAVAGGKSLQLQINVSLSEGLKYFEIQQQGRHSNDLIASGEIVSSPISNTSASIFDIGTLIEQCPMHLNGETLYEAYRKMGVNYGESFRNVKAIFYSDQAAIGRVLIPQNVGEHSWQIAPGVLDAIFQVTTAIGLPSPNEFTRGLQLPVAIEELTQLEILEGEVYCYARLLNEKDEQRCFQLDVLNSAGQQLLKINNFITTSLQKAHKITEQDAPQHSRGEMVLAQASWQKVPIQQAHDSKNKMAIKVFVCDNLIKSLDTINQPTGVDLTQLAIDKEASLASRSRYIFDVIFGELVNGFKTNRPQPIVVILPETERNAGHLLSGLFKSASRENSKFWGSILYLNNASQINELSDLLNLEIQGVESGCEKIYLGNNNFSQRVLIPIEDDGGKIQTELQGVCWITGGAGGLGRILAEDLAFNHNCNVVLSGRQPANEKLKAYVKNMQEQGANITYIPCDVSKLDQVEQAYRKIEFQHGAVSHVFHCAGIADDALIRNKTWQSIDRVFAAKVSGVENLDLVTVRAPLKSFVCYASLAGVLGNVGQSDYAAANAFLESFVANRNAQVACGERVGKSIAIAWPLWQSEGMMPSPAEQRRMRDSLGLSPMPSNLGLEQLKFALSASGDSRIVGYGDSNKIRELFFGATEKTSADLKGTTFETGPRIEDKTLIAKAVESKLVGIFAEVLKLPKNRITAKESFDNFGINSLVVMAITDRLEDLFGDVSKTLVYEHQTIEALAVFLLEAYPETCAECVPQPDTLSGTTAAVLPESLFDSRPKNEPENLAQALNRNISEVEMSRQEAVTPGDFSDEIAIVGIAGQYPQSDDLEEYWKNLIEGKDCVTEIPEQRWDLARFFDAEKGVPGRSYSKWGGFLRHVDKFDPLFFNIAPRDAIALDPQERLFLQTVWQTLENAGYTRKTLKNISIGGGKIGVYVGVMYEEYQFLGIESSLRNSPLALAGNPSSIANRVSYFLDLNGPCMAVDTMCSSSLTAIHLACQSIKSGECELAIAGGVNVSVHPNKYLYLSQNNVVSSKGRCEAFGEGGDGYVPAEGVGALLLKPLSKALADGDVIHGLVKGTSINHGGKTSGFTVPNPNAQAKVVADAIYSAGINARDISYLEAHGTGTALGDPIEISGLSKAFTQFSEEKQFCAIGSAKSNIGHCESAAGVAGISKILLQMRHGKFAPSLHSQTINSKIDFTNTPFFIQKDLGEWPAEFIEHEGELRRKARIAGVSSFGAGGSNGHIIIEEFVARPYEKIAQELPHIVVLSARTQEQLRERVSKLNSFLREGQFSDNQLSSLAYTLQVGREAMQFRMGFVACGIDEITHKLTRYLQNNLLQEQGMYYGNAREISAPSDDDYEIDVNTMNDWRTDETTCDRLLSHWVRGGEVNWAQFYGDTLPRRMSLPDYPFALDRYWVDIGVDMQQPSDEKTKIEPHKNPLLQGDAQWIDATQHHSLEFTGNEFFLRDHQINSEKVLPGVAYLEMVRAAASESGLLQPSESASLVLKDVHWMSPAKVRNDRLSLRLDLQHEDNQSAAFSISSSNGTPHCRGGVALQPLQAVLPMDVAQLKASCNKYVLNAEQSYQRFDQSGLDYGSGFRGIQALYIGQQQLLAKLKVPEELAAGTDNFQLHPSVMDASLQAIIGLLPENTADTYLPFGAALVEIHSQRPQPVWAWVNEVESLERSKKFNIDLLAESGDLCVRLCDLTLRAISKATDTASAIPQPLQNPENELSHTLAVADFRIPVSDVIVAQLAKALGLETQWINLDESFSDYGLDSINGIELVDSLNRELGVSLDVTSIFDFSSVNRLSKYICEEFTDVLRLKFTPVSAAITPVDSAAKAPVESVNQTITASSLTSWDGDNIAIVGVSGRFAESETLTDLWQHLAEGRDLIRDVARWDITPNTSDLDKSRMCAQGSFVADIEEFDARFFSISGAEAIYMDPQQRIFLEEAWLALEDAGYAGGVLEGAACGIYVGCNDGDYQNLFINSPYPAQAFWGNSGSILPARLAYLLDLKGPALAIDTACSSSLVAIHTAAQALRSGEVNYALAGGVFVQSTAEFYQYANRAGMLSPRGRCHSFDARADGFVPGEGAGVVLLKRLSDALADGDHIHGVIVGSACNQDGATNGITAPSANSQERLERQVYERHGIDAASIQMVEAHGTGTMLGDPIEFQALTRAFRKDTDDRQFCALGSIKSNLGHTATAAGVSGVLKILLAMKHQQIPPSLHFEQGNPNIDFDNSPFFVNTQLRDWPANRDGLPRRAAVSSFGFSGTNVHMVIDQGPECQRVSPKRPGYLVVLSADSEAQLHTLVERLHDHVNATPDIDLGHLSFTLLQGRKHLTQRLAWVVASRDELLTQWQAYLVQRQEAYRGDLKQSPWRGDHSAQHAVQQHLEHASWDNAQTLDALQHLAQAYCSGCPLDTRALFPGEQFARIPLPGYPFARQRYWISDQLREQSAPPATAHPLIHHNHSNFERQQYRSVFQGQEIFLRDHKVRGDAVLPGVAYLEMAREALARSVGSRPGTLVLSDVAWLQPITEAQFGGEITTELAWQSDDRLQFNICSGNASVHAQGIAQWQDRHAESVPLKALRARLQTELSGAQCYDTFKRLGIDYGASHRCLETLWCGEGEVLAHLKQSHTTSVDGEYLDPGLLDAALQAALGLIPNEQRLAIPQAAEQVVLHAIPGKDIWVWVREISRHHDGLLVDIDLCNSSGAPLLSIAGLKLHFLNQMPVRHDISGEPQLRVFTPLWSAVSAHGTPAQTVFVCDLDDMPTAQLMRDGTECAVISSEGATHAERYLNLTLQIQARLKALLQTDPHCRAIFLLRPEAAGLSGLVRSARKEYPQSQLQTLIVADRKDDAQLVEQLLTGVPGELLRWGAAQMQMEQWQLQENAVLGNQSDPVSSLAWQENGVYLITGGVGGLGLIFAREIARCAPGAVLLLTGRRAHPENLPGILAELAALGAKPHYKSVDVSDACAVNTLIAEVLEEHRHINGILHSAGVLQDGLLSRKSAREFEQVFAPKVAGLENLDRAIAGRSLDWFVACSSASAVLGNAGQSDYAAANGFMDVYLAQRQERVNAGEAFGTSLSINWPLWDEGGMGLSGALREKLWRSMGVAAMPTPSGLQAWKISLLQNAAQSLVLYGNDMLFKSVVQAARTAETPLQEIPSSQELSPRNQNLESSVDSHLLHTELAKMAATILCINQNDVDAVTDFGDFGFDSISLTRFAGEINSRFGVSLTPALFYEHSNLEGLIHYLVTEHQAAFLQEASQNSEVQQHKTEQPTVTPELIRQVQQSTARMAQQRDLSAMQNHNEIAIIGLSACFPKSDDLAQYWQNLVNNRDCIDEIPETRWDWKKYFGEPEEGLNQSNVKWGGFMRGADEFDPLFFGISPGEAKLMDPNQRLIMQYCWQAIEDAGYSAESLAGSDTGIFVGTGCSGYTGLLAEYGVATEAQTSTGMAASVGPNRMSFFLDVHGPSEPVETACSSSLVAIHRAVKSIQQGESRMALAGGVNALASPHLNISFNKAGMLCDDGRCKTFSENANGYVRAEGAAILLLKKRSDAERDGDHIYALIKGTAENHGGRANSLTAPNTKAQAAVIQKAVQQAGIDPQTITYIEAHGTGTSLGDPVEINGLKSAFAQLGVPSQDSPFCGIGSVKSNIGHAELAAGVAGLVKVILQMKHKQLVASLHCDAVNPYIELTNSPFYIVTENQPWLAPIDEQGRALPRRAGISSFGFGGANAHVIVEEYIPAENLPLTNQGSVLVVLSARTAEQLQQRTAGLVNFLKETDFADAYLPQLAYTLQVGREQMVHRLALVVGSVFELQQRLVQWQKNPLESDIYSGVVDKQPSALMRLTQDKDFKLTLDAWLAQQRYEKLLELWVQGLQFDWHALYTNRPMRRISLPGYPFARERYWVEATSANVAEVHQQLHPLVHANSSTLQQGQKYSSVFNGREFFLADHQMNKQMHFPEMACLEMAREAICLATGRHDEQGTSLVLKQVRWLHPLVATKQGLNVDIGVQGRGNGEIAFRIQVASQQVVSEGLAEHRPLHSVAQIDLDALRLSCTAESFNTQRFYQRYRELGLVYGSSMQGLKTLYLSEKQLLAEVEIPEVIAATEHEYVLHPSLLDACLHATIGFSNSQDRTLFIPEAIDELEIISACNSPLWVWIQALHLNENQRQFDLTLADKHGKVCGRIKGFTLRKMQQADAVGSNRNLLQALKTKLG